MANRHLSRDPHHVGKDKTWWWYEEPGGITVLCEYRAADGSYEVTRELKIPWSAIRAALKRKDQK